VSAPLAAAVTGVSLWTPHLPGFAFAAEVLAGRAAPAATALPRPAPALLAPTERRRAPDTVAIALEAALRACEMAGADPRALPSVFASSYGDLPISDWMCATLAATPTLLSPTKFHNSVHNAAAGYWTIGTGCQRASTALCAWHATFGAGLLAALVEAVADDTPVLFVAYDVGATGPMATITPSRGLLAAAFVLEPAATVTRPVRARLTATLETGQAAAGGPPVPPAWDAAVGPNAMRSGLALVAALASGRADALRWDVGRGTRLAVEVQPTGGGSAP
jgi:hypothetical protein